MIKYFFTILLILTVSVASYAQINDLYNYNYLHKIEAKKHKIDISSNSYYASNSINNSFFNVLLTNNYIDNDLKASNNIQDINYFGSESFNNISYYFVPDTFICCNDFGFKFDLSNVSRINARFTDDLFNLAFYGNKMFAGETAGFTDSFFQSTTYQKFSIGLFKQTYNEGNNLTYYIGASIINGQENKYLSLYRSNLFTEETGEYIDFDMQMKYYYSNEGKTNFLENNGIGGAVNFAIVYENTDKDYIINLSVEDLGYIKWNKNARQTYVDSVYHFEGVEIENVLDYENYSSSEISKDSLMSNVFANTFTNSYTRLLNERINISVSKNLIKDNLFTTLGLGYLYNSGEPKPVFYTRSNYKYNDKVSNYLQVAYGGFTTFQIGIGASFNIKNFDLTIASNNIAGVVIPDKTYSQSVFVRLGYLF